MENVEAPDMSKLLRVLMLLSGSSIGLLLAVLSVAKQIPWPAVLCSVGFAMLVYWLPRAIFSASVDNKEGDTYFEVTSVQIMQDPYLAYFGSIVAPLLLKVDPKKVDLSWDTALDFVLLNLPQLAAWLFTVCMFSRCGKWMYSPMLALAGYSVYQLKVDSPHSSGSLDLLVLTKSTPVKNEKIALFKVENPNVYMCGPRKPSGSSVTSKSPTSSVQAPDGP